MTRRSDEAKTSERARAHAALLEDALKRPGIPEIMRVYGAWRTADRGLDPYRAATKKPSRTVTTDHTNVRPGSDATARRRPARLGDADAPVPHRSCRRGLLASSPEGPEMASVRTVVSACVLSTGMLLAPALAGAQATHAHAAAAPLVVGSPDSEEVRALPVDARPALTQRIAPVANWLEHDPKNIAVLGHECPDGWTARTTADGKKKLYVPLGLLVDETGSSRTSYTLFVACERP